MRVRLSRKDGRHEGVWAAIDDQRRRTADLLESLREQEWRQPSLCEGWTVRDVAAHLTLQQLGIGDAARLVARHPRALLDMNHLIHDSSVAKAARPTDQLVREIRAMIGSRRHNVGVTPLETLIDILVHSQDIAIPLGRRLEMAPEAAAKAAERVWSSRGTRKDNVFVGLPLEGYRLSATDVEWSAGEGVEVRGSAGALLLLLCGRRVALDRVAGDGAESLRQGLQPA